MEMGWFSNRGQVLQLAVACIACVMTGINAWPAIKEFQLLSLAPSIFYLVLISAAFLFAFRKPNQPIPANTIPTPVTAVPSPPALPVKTPSANEDNPLKGTAKITKHKLSIGQAWDIGEKRKVTFREIQENKITPQGIFVPESEFAAELNVSLGGKLVYWGPGVESISHGRYAVPVTIDGFHAEPGSLYAFSYSDTHFYMEILTVEHINPHAKEIDLVYCLVRINNYSRL